MDRDKARGPYIGARGKVVLSNAPWLLRRTLAEYEWGQAFLLARNPEYVPSEQLLIAIQDIKDRLSTIESIENSKESE